MTTVPTFNSSVRRIIPLAWPVLIGQMAVLGFGTVDTILIARFSASDLAALSIGMAAYITIFVGFMGVLLANGPVTGQLFGAGKPEQAGQRAYQAVWLALMISGLGSALLVWPDPFITLTQSSPEVADKVRGYLGVLAFSLPASMLFTVYRGFNNAVSRPKAVMALQVAGFALKVPLSLLFIYGFSLPLPWGSVWQVAPLGVVGCALATACIMWAQTLIAAVVVWRDPFYARFGLHNKRFPALDWKALKELLRLGIPMGASILIEVTGFSFMALLIARQSSDAVAGHQLAANLVSIMFMLPLALANGTGTLVAQRVGAKDLADAKALGWHGLILGVGLASAVALVVYGLRVPILALYTDNPVILAAALPLVAWLCAFHVADAAQTLANFVLRSHRVTLMPLLLYSASLWGIGLGGGYWVTTSAWAPAALQGAQGYWAMGTVGLGFVALSLCGLLAWVHRAESPVNGT